MKKLDSCNLAISCFGIHTIASSVAFYGAFPTKLPFFLFCLHQQIHLGLGIDQKHLPSATELQFTHLSLIW